MVGSPTGPGRALPSRYPLTAPLSMKFVSEGAFQSVVPTRARTRLGARRDAPAARTSLSRTGFLCREGTFLDPLWLLHFSATSRRACLARPTSCSIQHGFLSSIDNQLEHGHQLSLRCSQVRQIHARPWCILRQRDHRLSVCLEPVCTLERQYICTAPA